MKINKLYIFIFLACFFGYIWLLFFNSNHVKSSDIDYTVCLFKKTTGYPCVSCGTTRAVLHFFNGHFLTSVLLNPLGIAVALIMIVAPVWIAIDWYSKKHSFYIFYIKIEKLLKIKKVYFVLAFLLILNWIWNIKKQI